MTGLSRSAGAFFTFELFVRIPFYRPMPMVAYIPIGLSRVPHHAGLFPELWSHVLELPRCLQD